MAEGIKLPYPYIHGLTKRQQFEIWRDFQALVGQVGAGGSAGAQLPPNVRMVAGARAGKIASSPDGIVWTERDSGFGSGNYVYGIGYSPQLRKFVAVGDSGKIATSSTGILWELQTSPTTNTLYSVCWSSDLGLFVVGTSNGNVLVSTDGEDWTEYDTPWSTSVGDIAWSSDLGLFAGVAGFGMICTSPDGVNWTQRTHSMGYLNSMVWNEVHGVFHTCENTPSPGAPNHGYSTDGITWQTWATGPTADPGCTGFAGPDCDVLATFNGSGSVDVSTDGGTTWSNHALGVNMIVEGATRSSVLDLYVIAGYVGFGGGPRILTSPDSVTWTSRGVPFTDELNCVCAANLD